MKSKLALFVASLVGAFSFVQFVVIPHVTPTAASPTHVVNVYLDGLNHMDYRQACGTIHAPVPFPTLSQCEAYFAFNTAMTGAQEYRIVKGSQKVWTETYKRRYNCAWVTYPDGKLRMCMKTKVTRVRLAVVQYANLTTPYILTAHLRIIHGAWKLVAVTT